MEKVAIYCRLSDEDKNKTNGYDDSQSIATQKAILTRYVKERGWQIGDIYVDDGYTGLNFDRPSFQRMLKDIEEKNYTVVITKDMSRLGRDYIDVGYYTERYFPEKQIRYIAIDDNVDTEMDSNNNDVAPFKAVINDMYSKDISKKIKSSLNSRRQEGKFIGSFAPYGYKKHPDNRNRLIVDKEVANVIKQIYDWYLLGVGTQKIAYRLNERGIPNPTFYKKQQGLKFKNSSQTDAYGLWNKTTIRRILKNPVYIGHMAQGKRKKVNYKSKKVIPNKKNNWILVENTHEAIIDEETFKLVQNRLKTRSRSTGTGKAHLFATKLKCLDCGSTLYKIKAGNGYEYLRCKLYARDPKKKLCTSHSVRLDNLIEVVESRIREYIKMLDDESNLENRLSEREEFQERVSNFKDELVGIETRIKEKEKMMKNLYIDKVKELITEEQFIQLNKEFSSEKDKLLERKREIESKIYNIKSKSSNVGKWIDIVMKYKNFDKLTHVMVNELIDYIEIGQKNRKIGEQIINIHWLF
ncbi:recombinase family protein [Dethiothermospora halolimnae]|uniref:recombinase family protein n=1 Tax=Dethiothermospora halolimnae TaxID=3114390 RepID=UPI003CCBED91